MRSQSESVEARSGTVGRRVGLAVMFGPAKVGARRCLARTSRQGWLRVLGGADASQLVEFALVLPFLLALSVGVSDFGGAYNLKQKLNNAAREGARFASSLSCADCTQAAPASTKDVQNVVVNYLTNARVDVCGMTTSTSPTAGPGALTWTYTSSNCAATSTPFTLIIERGYTFVNSSGTTVVASRVTLTYPYSWSFARIIKLLLPSASYASSFTISTDATMQN